MENSSNTSSGIGLCTILFLIFLVLKLTGYINWSWWWVTAPLWIGWAIVLVILAILGLAYLFTKHY